MRLTIRSGADSGKTAEVTGEGFLIGRDEECDLVLSDDNVSRRHAFLRALASGRVLLTDLGSSNGTFVNGRRIEAPVELAGGEQLRFGNTILATRGTSATVVAPTGMWLTIEAGSHRGVTVEVTGERFLIGRDVGCHLVLHDPKVSDQHASLRLLSNGRALLTDLGSGEGVFVDGRRIEEPVLLEGSERLRLGDTVLSASATKPAKALGAPHPAGRLMVSSGADRGRIVELTGERFLIGRGSGCDLLLSDEKVSRYHSALTPLAGRGALVEDLGSRNGTYVDGRRIDGTVELKGNEQLRLGDTELRFGADVLLPPDIPETRAPDTVEEVALIEAARPSSLRSLLSTEGLARACSRRPWLTIGAWTLALLVAGTLAVGLLQDTLTSEVNLVAGNPESIQGNTLLEERLRGPRRITEIVIVRSPTLTVDDPAFERRVQTLFQEALAFGPDVIEGGTHYYRSRDESLVSATRRTALVPLVMAGDFDQAESNIGELMELVRGADADSNFDVFINGEASIGRDFQELSEEDLRTGEAYGLAAALLVLVCVFGALVAALLPAVLALVSIAVALGLAALVGQAFELSIFVINMIVGMGLALGIDYCLFILMRYREERAAGRDKMAAIAASGATSSRAVFFSGTTVVFALLGLLIVPDRGLRSLGIGAILVGLVSVLAALSLLPAVLGLMGDRVNALRIPIVGRRSAGGEAEGGLWTRVAHVVMIRPVVSLVVAAGLLIAASVPVFDLRTGSSGVSTLPDRLPAKQGFLVLNQEFSAGRANPAEIVIDGRIDAQPVQAGIERLEARLAEAPAFGEPNLQVNDGRNLALLSVPLEGDVTGPQATRAVRRLRSDYIPEAFSAVPARVLVTGTTARSIDYADGTNRSRPLVFAFVLGLSFILLTIAFRSIVIPLKAIVMNLLSVGAAYGLLVLVFQKGVGADLLGFQQIDTVEAWVPLFLFAILFGLSMDYHVFLLSRIRERFIEVGDNSEAVAYGIGSTARIITGAALIMVAVFGGFAAGELVMFQQMGFGLGVALLLDATVVRSVLVPATMALLGKRNWYLPSWLGWLPDVRVEGLSTASRESASQVRSLPAPPGSEMQIGRRT